MKPDSADYLMLSDNLVLRGEYSREDQPEIFRVPGYPAFLALFRFFSRENIFWPVFAQVILGTVNCIMVWLLCRKIFGRKNMISLTASIFQAISLVSIVYSALILSETLYVFLMLLLLWDMENIFACHTSKGQVIYSVSAGICAGLCCMVRAVTLPLVPVFLIYIYLSGKNRIKSVPAIMAAFIIPVVIIAGGWITRNISVCGYNGFSSVGAVNLYRYSSCAVIANNNRRSFNDQQKIIDSETALLPNQRESANYCLSKGLETFKSNPFSFIFLHIKSGIKSLLPAAGEFFKLIGFQIGNSGTANVIQSQGLIAGIKHYFNGKWGLFLLAIPALFLLLVKYCATFSALIFSAKKKEHLPVFIFYTVLIAYFVFVPGPASHPRFRVPAEPLISIMAAYGLYELLKFIKKKESKIVKEQ